MDLMDGLFEKRNCLYGSNGEWINMGENEVFLKTIL